ncbi:MAG TPA: hypothetical protein VNS63_00070 [Blastocatellia bacterium]|nr:hypothetical protein [Blastocatellia bacterium]
MKRILGKRKAAACILLVPATIHTSIGISQAQAPKTANPLNTI